MAPRWIGAAAIALFAVPAQNSLPAWAQEDKGQYIKTIFMAHIGELPGMAWMMAPNAIITNKKSESVILYTRSDSIEEVRYARAYSEVEIDKIRRKHCLALVPGRFYQYHRSRDGGRIPPKQDRALYTKTSFEGDVKAGHSNVNLEDKALTHVVGLAEFRERPSLHNYFAIRVTGSTYISTLFTASTTVRLKSYTVKV